MKSALFLSAFAALLLVSASSRVDPFADVQSFMSTDADGTLHSSAQAMLEIMRGGKSRDEEGCHSIYAIKFYVPPSETHSFEDRWMDFDKDMRRKDEPNVHSLKRAKMTNVLYYNYAEYRSMGHMHDHMTSGHFKDFSDWVDKHCIKWHMELLHSYSDDIEKEQKKKRVEHHRRMFDEDAESHVLIQYNVPPGEHTTFVKQWTKLAEDTIREDENSVYSLRKIATDNTRFWGYGTWDSMKSYMEHFESKHLGKFMDYTEDADVTWFIIPLEEIGGEHK